MTARADLSDEALSDLTRRGYSRRSIGKVLSLFAAAPALGSALARAFSDKCETVIGSKIALTF